MGFPWGAAVGAAGSVAGDVFGAIYSGKQASAESSRARKFQLYMASTAYQRTMEDLRKAGLNPILAYKQGPASAPGGVAARMPDLSGAGSRAAASAKGLAMVDSQRKLLDAQSFTQQVLANKYDAETAESMARTRIQDAGLTRAQAEAEVYRRHPELLYWEKTGAPAIHSARRLFSPLGKVRGRLPRTGVSRGYRGGAR